VPAELPPVTDRSAGGVGRDGGSDGLFERDGRLDVELALLACQWMKGAVSWLANDTNDAPRDHVSVTRS